MNHSRVSRIWPLYYELDQIPNTRLADSFTRMDGANRNDFAQSATPGPLHPSSPGNSRYAGSAIGAGVCIAVAVVVVLLVVLPGLTPPPAQIPPFWFTVELSGTGHSADAYSYNLSLHSISNPNVSTSWTQFYLFTGSAGRASDFAVQLLDVGGHPIGLFNSSQSHWEGGSNGVPPSPDMGGWEVGNGTEIVTSDTFQVESPVSIGSDYMLIGMTTSTSPHFSSIDWVLL
jgi:hypothetical protein